MNFSSTHNKLCFVGYGIGAYIAPIPHADPKKLLTLQQNICTNNLDNFQLTRHNVCARITCCRFVHTSTRWTFIGGKLDVAHINNLPTS